jgi:hypothetical protein
VITATVAAVLATGLAPGRAMAEVTAADQAASVTSTVYNADGTITETVYTPAPGVTSADLAQNLKASGVANLAVKNEGDVTALAASCSLGTARTWASSATCFVRWSYNGAVRPIIDFVDHSGASWPVGRAVTKWNETSGIDSIYRPASSGCDGAPTHCVNVYSKNYGATGWTGLTSRTLYAAQTYYTNATTELNDYYGGTETQKWNTACHELGHVLGLDHNISTTSCLYYARISTKYPNADDFNLLERYY